MRMFPRNTSLSALAVVAVVSMSVLVASPALAAKERRPRDSAKAVAVALSLDVKASKTNLRAITKSGKQICSNVRAHSDDPVALAQSFANVPPSVKLKRGSRHVKRKLSTDEVEEFVSVFCATYLAELSDAFAAMNAPVATSPTLPPTLPPTVATTQPTLAPTLPTSALMPNVICMSLQAAQDRIQLTGVFFSRSFDATGQGRSQFIDSNWVVVSQSPAPGTPIGEGDASLGAVKYGEPSPC